MVVSNEADRLVFIEVVSVELPRLTVEVIVWFVFKTIVDVVEGLVVFNPLEIVNSVDTSEILSVDELPFVDVVNDELVFNSVDEPWFEVDVRSLFDTYKAEETDVLESVGNPWLVVLVANEGLLLNPVVKDIGLVFCWFDIVVIKKVKSVRKLSLFVVVVPRLVTVVVNRLVFNPLETVVEDAIELVSVEPPWLTEVEIVWFVFKLFEESWLFVISCIEGLVLFNSLKAVETNELLSVDKPLETTETAWLVVVNVEEGLVLEFNPFDIVVTKLVSVNVLNREIILVLVVIPWFEANDVVGLVLNPFVFVEDPWFELVIVGETFVINSVDIVNPFVEVDTTELLSVESIDVKENESVWIGKIIVGMENKLIVENESKFVVVNKELVNKLVEIGKDCIVTLVTTAEMNSCDVAVNVVEAVELSWFVVWYNVEFKFR